MNRYKARHASAFGWLVKRLVIAALSFVAGVVVATWDSPRATDAVLTSTPAPSIREQRYDTAYAKACEESNGVVVVRVLKPNGLECAWAEALLPLGPEVR